MLNPQSHRCNPKRKSVLMTIVAVFLFASVVNAQEPQRPPTLPNDPVIPSDVFAADDLLTDLSTQALAPSPCVPGLGGRVFATGDFVQIVVLEPFADFTSQIIIFSPGPVRTLASSRDLGRVVSLGTFPRGTELVFGIRVNETGLTFKMGPGFRNPDSEPHAIVQCAADGSAIVGFEDKVNSDSLDYNDVRFQILQTPASSAQITFNPPFQFFNGCTASREQGEASVNLFSRPITGDLHLGVQTTFVGEAFGRTGAGVIFTPTFSGPVRIRSLVNVLPPSADALYALNVAALGSGAVVALNSDVFVQIVGSGPSINRFRAANINSLKPGTRDLVRLFPALARALIFVPTLEADSHIYRPGELYIAEFDTNVTAGQPLRICGGLQSSAVAASLPAPLFAAISARYEAKLVRIVIEPR